MNKTKSLPEGANIPVGGDKTKHTHSHTHAHNMSHPVGIHAMKESKAGQETDKDEQGGGGCYFI